MVRKIFSLQILSDTPNWRKKKVLGLKTEKPRTFFHELKFKIRAKTVRLLEIIINSGGKKS